MGSTTLFPSESTIAGLFVLSRIADTRLSEVEREPRTSLARWERWLDMLGDHPLDEPEFTHLLAERDTFSFLMR